MLNHLAQINESVLHRLEIIDNVKKQFPYHEYEEKERKRNELDQWIAKLEQRLERERYYAKREVYS